MASEFLAENWTWFLAALLGSVVTYWWWDERDPDATPGETVDNVTDRAESFTGGVLSGFRSLIVGIAAIMLTVSAELMGLAADLNALLGGVPYLLGYLAYGALSFFGVTIGLERQTLGFAFILILVVAGLVKFGNGADGGAA